MSDTNTAAIESSPRFLVLSVALITVLVATRTFDPAKAYADTNSYQWTKVVDQDLRGGGYTAVASSADGSHVITSTTNAASGANPLYISDNYGATWQDVSSSVDPGIDDYWQAVAVSNDGETMVAVSNQAVNLSNNSVGSGQIFISHNGGISWQNITPNSGTEWEYVAISGDGSKIAALTGDDMSDVYISNDGGANWTTSATTAQVNVWWSVSISDSGDKVLVGGENSNNLDSLLDISDNGGASWTDVTPDDSSTVAAVFNFRATLSPDGNELAAASFGYSNATNNEYDAVYVSSDNGTNWTTNTPDQSNSDTWNAIALSNVGTLMVGNNNNNTIFNSTDYGTDWNEEDPSLADQSANDWTAIALSANGAHAVALSSANEYVGPDPTLLSSSPTTPPFNPASATASKTTLLPPPTGYGVPSDSARTTIVQAAALTVAGSALLTPLSRRLSKRSYKK